jgi:5-formyltetrahydrofolate cyclo-ligase
MNKEFFRPEAIRVRDNIESGINDADDAARNFFEAIAPVPGQSVALYWPKGREFDTLPLMHELLLAGITCALPVIQKDERLLKFAAYKDGDAMEEGPFKVVQPKISDSTIWVDPDIFVIPLLAFDRHGNRMGYGKGHYDATLKHYRAIKPVVAVGYAYGQQAVLFNLPAEPHDEKMDWIITPQKAQRFTA